MTPVSTAPSWPASQFTVCTSRFTRPRSKGFRAIKRGPVPGTGSLVPHTGPSDTLTWHFSLSNCRSQAVGFNCIGPQQNMRENETYTNSRSIISRHLCPSGEWIPSVDPVEIARPKASIAPKSRSGFSVGTPWGCLIHWPPVVRAHWASLCSICLDPSRHPL